MYYIAETSKLFDQAAIDLEAAVKRHGFGVLHVHDLGGTLQSKDQHYKTKSLKSAILCAGKVLSADMRLNRH